MNYPIADFIIRIKNAAAAKRREVVLPYSRINQAIGVVLVKEQFLLHIQEDTKENKKVLVAKIRYEKRNPVLTSVSIVSKPSLRVYIPLHKIGKIQRKGLTTLILSTSKGIITGEEASKKKVGGELLFEIS